MKLAAVVPVGYTDRMGYQHTFMECYENWGASADGLYIMPSIEGEPAGVVTQPAVRFARKPDGSPWFDAYLVMENVNLGLEFARDDDHDAALVLMCNQYVHDADALRAQAERMLVRGQPWTWYYRADQLAGEMFGPSVRLPWLVNLRAWTEMRFSVDCLVANGDVVPMERGDYREPPLVVDVQLEMTRAELAEKMNFIRCYADLVPKRKPVFEWGYWFPYYVDKFRKKRRRPDLALTATGDEIAAASRPDFVSREVLGCL